MAITPGLTDDELVEIVARKEYEALTMPLYWTDVEERVREGYRKFVRRIIARIRRPLEARGIGVAAEYIDQPSMPYTATPNQIVAQIYSLARQHAAGEDGA